MIKINEIKKQLEQDGYAVYSGIARKDVQRLTKLFRSLQSRFTTRHGLIISVLETDSSLKKHVHRSLLEVLYTYLNEIFEDFKTPIAHFFVKMPETAPAVPLHQDPMVTDQVNYPSYGTWFALEDYEEGMGRVCVVPGSHKWFSPFRSESYDPVFQENIQVFEPYLKPLNLKCGDVLIMNNRLVHGSEPNKSEFTRVAPIVKVAPRQADLVICYQNPGNKKNYAIRQPDDFYLNATWLDQKDIFPEGEILGEIKGPNDQLSSKALQNIIENRVPSPVNSPLADYLV